MRYPHVRRSKHDNPALVGTRHGDRVITAVEVRKGGPWWTLLCDCGDVAVRKASEVYKGTSPRCVGCQRRRQSAQLAPMWKGGRHIPLTLYNKWCKGAAKRAIPWSLDMTYLDDLLEKQEWRCALTGAKLTLDHGEAKAEKNGTASLDRIDSSKSYEPGNVQFSTKIVNVSKQNFSQEAFISMCIEVANHAGGRDYTDRTVRRASEELVLGSGSRPSVVVPVSINEEPRSTRGESLRCNELRRHLRPSGSRSPSQRRGRVPMGHGHPSSTVVQSDPSLGTDVQDSRVLLGEKQ